MSTLHKQEYRLYRMFWITVPIALAAIVFTIPAFQKAPEVKVILSDSLPDYLYKANEPIQFRFIAADLNRDQFQSRWTFGDSIYVWDLTPLDSCEIILKARVDWNAGQKNELGLKMGLQYDSFPAPARYGWLKTVHVNDSNAKIMFPKAGRYRFKLELLDTIRELSYLQEQEIDVVPSTKHSPRDTIVKIVGPKKGLVGEELVFSATGSKVNFWYWKFGDDKHQDDNRPQVVYSYSQEGRYEVLLKTDHPDRWFSHWVDISPTWNADSIPIPIEDSTAYVIEQYKINIKAKLQAIANTSPSDVNGFYKLKSLIERNYLSERLMPIDVWVNQDESPIDFDSYCQRIHFLEGNLNIDEVSFEWDGDSTRRRIANLSIQQRRLNK